MSNQIREISKKHGEHMVRMAIDHVISVGVNNLKDVNADEICAKILRDTPANYIMTPEFRAELMRCAIELANVPIGDILKYIQTDMAYDGVTVHPGIILEFRQNATCNHIMTCIAPPDTEEEKLDEVYKVIESKIDAYMEKTGSCYGFSFTSAIEEAFREAKIRISDLPVDRAFYL